MKLNRDKILRYEKEMAGELVHIDLHKRKNIKGENPNKKKYMFLGLIVKSVWLKGVRFSHKGEKELV